MGIGIETASREGFAFWKNFINSKKEVRYKHQNTEWNVIKYQGLQEGSEFADKAKYDYFRDRWVILLNSFFSVQEGNKQTSPKIL